MLDSFQPTLFWIMNMKSNLKKWSDVRRYLHIYNQDELINIIGELYKLDDQIQYFIDAGCSETREEAIKPYRLLIRQYIFPNIVNGSERIQKAKARKIINNYWKATGDRSGKIDLMLLYIENGTQLSLTYGDIDESFYNSMIAMFKETISEAKKLEYPQHISNVYTRLEKIVNEANDIGWGYGDALKEYFAEAQFAYHPTL